MSNENNKNKDKNIRISENDILKKLYGGYGEPKNKEKPVKGKFSEDVIKNKLYGNVLSDKADIAKKAEPVPAANDLFAAKKPEQPKPAQEKPVFAKPAQEKSVYEKPKASYPEQEKTVKNEVVSQAEEIKIMPIYQEEIDALKQAISNLEDKLQKTELQKHKLKVRLVQKRKLINIRERLADLILNKMPEKFLLVFGLIIIVFLVTVFLNFRSHQPKVKKQPVETIESKQSLKSKPVKAEAVKPEVKQNNEQPQVLPIEAVRRYTIQVAEYADEDAAMSFIKELEAKGFQVYLNTIYRGANNTRPYFKINVGSFETFNEAKQYNEKFREKTKINDSFIRESK